VPSSRRIPLQPHGPSDGRTPGPNESRRRGRYLACLAGIALVALAGCESIVPGTAREEQPVAFPRPFQIIAHRGASAYAPENTIAAYRQALALGAVEVELDVQLTRDDQVLLFHDATLEQKTGLPGRVRDYTLAVVRDADIGAWFDRTHPEADAKFAGTGLNTLAELFEEMGDRLFYHVELKDAEVELPRLTLEVVDRFGLRDRVLFTSFRFEQLERVRELAPELPTCLLIDRQSQLSEPQAVWMDRAAWAGLTEVGLPAEDLTVASVARARELGLLIRAWRIKSLEDMERAIRVGSNGMTIDWPEKLIRRSLEAGGTPGWR
jgi:glycerophosphoryl diester phosphodiesterase